LRKGIARCLVWVLRLRAAPDDELSALIGPRKVAFLLDVCEYRKARRPAGGLALGQRVEPLQHGDAVLAQADRDGRLWRR
jgi:hypothetical protein